MKRQILLPLLPGKTDDKRIIARPTLSRNLVALHQLFSAYGYKLVLGVMDEHPLPEELLKAADCRDMLEQAVTINIMQKQDFAEYAGMLLCTEVDVSTLEEIDSIPPLQNAVADFYTSNKVVAVQNSFGLQIINPRLLHKVSQGVNVVEGFMPLTAGHTNYVNLLIDLISQQFNSLMYGDDALNQRLHTALAAIGTKTSQH